MCKRLFMLCLVLTLAISLTGCGRHRGSGSVAVTPGTPDKKVVSTKIETPKVELPPTSIRGAIRANTLATEALTGATVTLTLADGTSYELTEDASTAGLYKSAEIEITGPFVIEAKKGELLIQNIVTDVAEMDKAITCNHVTTAFAQVALTTAKSESGSGVTELKDVIKATVTLSFELTTFKDMFTLEPSNLSSLVVQIIEMVVETLMVADTEATTATAKVVDLETIKSDIVGIAPTISKDDVKTEIDPIVESYLRNIVLKRHEGKFNEITEAHKALLTEDFINCGYNKADFLNSEEFDETVEVLSFDYTHSLTKIDNSNYLVYVNAKFKIKANGQEFTVTQNSAGEGYTFDKDGKEFHLPVLKTFVGDFPFLVTKVGNDWKVAGNLNKSAGADIEIDRQFCVKYDQNYNLVATESYTEFRWQFFPGKSYPIGEEEQPWPISLEETGEKWYNESWHSTRIDSEPTQGTIFTFKPEFHDGTEQEYHHKVPHVSNFTPFKLNDVKVTVNEDKTLTINWPQCKASGFDKYWLQLYLPNWQEENATFEGEEAITTTSYTSEGVAKEYGDIYFTVIFQTKLKNGMVNSVIYEKDRGPQ